METRDEYLKRIRKKTTPFILTMLILIICGMFIQGLFERRHQATPPIKIYKTTQPEKTLPDSKHKVDAETSITKERKIFPVETQQVSSKGVETPSQGPRESQSTTFTVSNEKSNVENDTDAKTETEKAKREAELAEWRAWSTEIDSILSESVQMQEEAKTVIAETVPHILEYLNTLSPEEQREYLKKTKKMMVSLSPPGLQEIADQNPELTENAWKMFIQMLVDQGYEPPRM